MIALDFDIHADTKELRARLARARKAGAGERIKKAEVELLAHADKCFGVNSATLTPEARAQAVELFGTPFAPAKPHRRRKGSRAPRE